MQNKFTQSGSDFILIQETEEFLPYTAIIYKVMLKGSQLSGRKKKKTTYVYLYNLHKSQPHRDFRPWLSQK